MQPRNEYPPGVPCWIDLTRPDPEAVAGFYRGLFGWELEERMPPGSGASYQIARLGGQVVAGIGSPDAPPTPAPGWSTYVAVADCDASAAKVVAAGGEVVRGPDDVPHAGRFAICKDPARAVFALWQAGERQGAEVVNDAGSWNFTEVSTPDVDREAAFLHDVFGWELHKLDMGPGVEALLLTLPGYGEFLMERNPELRGDHDAQGVPEHFIDAVAFMAQGEPGWGITFAVAGTDAAVERAVALGAEVLSPATDVGPTRVAVVEDPFGAVLTLSTYDPG